MCMPMSHEMRSSVPASLDAFARAQRGLACGQRGFRRPPPALAWLLVLVLLLLGFPSLLPSLAVDRWLRVQPKLLSRLQ
jgi:hypothetical protein